MNATEGRTRKALHQAVDGLIVSEHDMDRMEGNLMTLLDSRPTDEQTAPRRRREWAVAAVAAVALVVGGVALWQANTDSPPTRPAGRLAPQPSQPLVPPELVGLWQIQPDSPWLWEVNADGRILWTQTVWEYLEGAQNAITQREGDLYTVVRHDQGGCIERFRITVHSPQSATFRPVNDGTCGEDGSMGDLPMERVSPRDASVASLAPRFPIEASRPVTLGSQIEGSWVNQDSGRVLVVGPPALSGGRPYLVDDDGDGSVRPDQRGVLTVGADGSVRPQPDASPAGGCAPVFSKVVSNTATLVTTSGAGGCFPVGSTQTWLRLH